MSDAPRPPAPDVAEAVVEEHSRRISAIWAIPLVAVLIGAFLVYRTISEQGPTITITFKAAEGMEAGKTKIKYKDLDVGTVETIELAEDLSHVTVTASMVKGSDRYLTDGTRFFVVSAQVTAGRVTGIGTLFSGAYIGIDPSMEGKPQRDFVGLETQPIVTRGEAGTLYTLTSTKGGSFNVGAPVYYRRIRVGEVASYELSESGDHVIVKAFVFSPHDDRIGSNTRFWNASGIDVTMSAEGIQVDSASVTSMLIGGISFDTAEGVQPGNPVGEGDVLRLYGSRAAAFEQTYAIKRRYSMHFEESVDGLNIGAPVKLRGIQLGTVADVRLVFDYGQTTSRIRVLVDIEPERIIPAGQVATDAEEALKTLVKTGLRARLKTGSLLTGAKEIELVVLEDAEPVEVTRVDGYLDVPTVPTPLEALASNLARIVDRVQALPLEDIGDNLDRSLANLATTLENMEGVTKQLDAETLPALTAVADDANALLSPTSTVSTELRQLLIELRDAARSIRVMADYLEQHPEALIRGKGDGS
jgi:paraquat-inducible protein B